MAHCTGLWYNYFTVVIASLKALIAINSANREIENACLNESLEFRLQCEIIAIYDIIQ